MRTTKKPKLVVNPTDLEKLVTISKSQTAPHREVKRANILLQRILLAQFFVCQL